MTPPDLEVDVLQAKLSTKRDLLRYLASVGNVTAERLERDRMLRHAVERILTQLVDLAVSINGHAAALLDAGPPDDRESFRLAAEAGILSGEFAERLAPPAGLRNVLVHEYATIDLERVAESVTEARDLYGRYVTEVARSLNRYREGTGSV